MSPKFKLYEILNYFIFTNKNYKIYLQDNNNKVDFTNKIQPFYRDLKYLRRFLYLFVVYLSIMLIIIQCLTKCLKI